MTEQYFAHDPNVEHDEKVIDYHIDGIDLKFNTDAGVFSKNRVDYGSTVLIKTMKNVELSEGNILDLGTGYGPIGLFAAKFWPDKTVDMVHVNERALGLARKNAELNRISNVSIFESDIYSNVVDKYALILTNPPIRAGKKVVSAIIAEAKEHLLPSGKVLVVIQKKQGEPSARKLMKATYGNCQILQRDKGYYILESMNE